MTSITNQEAERCGFHYECGTWTRETKIHVTIVEKVRRRNISFGVYVFHGHPLGEYWRNDRPLLTVGTLAEAQEVAALLFGFAGSGKFANHITSIDLH